MLIALPIWDTEENGRTALTATVLPRLLETIRDADRVVVSDNGSCARTLALYNRLKLTYANFDVLYNERNLGIAEATNRVWRLRQRDEIVCKMDNDCYITSFTCWPVWIEHVFARHPEIGILGLKRKDLAEHPNAPEPHYRSTMYYADHRPGERWIPLEEVNHVMGTCYCFNPTMLPKFGYLMQPGTVYGFDDSLAAVRAHKLGYKTCFLPHIEIDHLDVDGAQEDPYTHWKHLEAGNGMAEYNRLVTAILRGEVSPYYDGGIDD